MGEIVNKEKIHKEKDIGLNKWKMNINACTKEGDNKTSYRTSSFPIGILDTLSWTEKNKAGIRRDSIDVITELCGNVFIIYRAKDEKKLVCSPPKGEPKVCMKDDNKETLRVFRDWLITKMVAGYKRVEVNCNDKTIIRSIKHKYVLPLCDLEVIEEHNILKENNRIELIFPDSPDGYKDQIDKCHEHLIELLEYTSDLLERLCKNGGDLTDRTIGMDDKVDFSNWSIWRNVHLSLLSKSYLVSRKDPYELAIYSAFAKSIERAADNCVGIARLANKRYTMTKNETIKIHLREVFSKLSELLNEIQKAFEQAYSHFSGRNKVDLIKFKKEHINLNREEVKKIFDISKASENYKGVEPDLTAEVWRDLGQIMSRTLRLISYPYNILLWRETEAVDLKKDVKSTILQSQNSNSCSKILSPSL